MSARGALEPSLEDIAAAERLAAVFAGHPDDEVERILPVLFLGAARGLPELELPAPARALIGRFVQGLALPPNATHDQLLQALERWLQETRSPLLTALNRFFREEEARGGDAAVGRAFSTFMDAAHKGVLDSGVRPKGTVAAGPLARFLVADPKKKS